MASKYFTVEVKPTIAASKQHEAQFANGDLLFDWTSFQLPRGANRLINATALVRPKGDAAPTNNPYPFQLVFGKSDTQSIGTVNGACHNRPTNDFLGFVEFQAGDYLSNGIDSTTMANLGSHVNPIRPVVLQGDITTGDNVGYDTLYVAAICNGTSMDFQTIIRLNDASGNMDVSVAGTTIATDGSGMDIQEHFIAGDVLHAHDDAVIGTVASVTDATDLELTSNFTADALADNDYVYNIHPIRLILQFER